jgi:intracellular sulfur oxidation DsrE/DsrF family protein
MIRTAALSLLFLAAAAIPASTSGQQGRGPGRGHDERHQDDHEVFQFLLSHHDQIHRKVTKLPNGVETITESDVPEVTEKIQEHVMWMEHRISETKPIRMRDPLFAELFRHTKQIDMQYEETARGVRVVETSADPYVAQLIQAHADVVSGFVARGFTEAMKNHPVPQAGNSTTPQSTEFMYPSIQGYGGVVQLAEAAQQPRKGSRILVDITQGGDPDKLNSAFDKVARFVNIYQGAGKEPADVQVAVILHGAATLSILDADSYAARFGTTDNPNFDCLHKLHEAGVEIYVCGQSLAHKQARADQVLVFVDVAVSALTTVVNLQNDGYVRIPL